MMVTNTLSLGDASIQIAYIHQPTCPRDKNGTGPPPHSCIQLKMFLECLPWAGPLGSRETRQGLSWNVYEFIFSSTGEL